MPAIVLKRGRQKRDGHVDRRFCSNAKRRRWDKTGREQGGPANNGK